MIQCNLDYGSVLWLQVSNKSHMKFMKSTLISFSRRDTGMYGLNYWERLKEFKLYPGKIPCIVPDQPAIGNIVPSAKDLYENNSNSLIDWSRY